MRLASLVLAITCLFASAASSKAQTLILALPHAPNYNDFDKEGNMVGTGVEVAQAIINRSQTDIGIVIVPALRAIEGLTTGKYAFHINIRQSVPDGIGKELGEVLSVPIVAWAAKGITLNEPLDLKKMVAVGIHRGSSPDLPFLEENNISLVSLPSLKTGIEMLSLGRLDAVVGSVLGVAVTAHQLKATSKLGQVMKLGDMSITLYVANGLKDSPATAKMSAALSSLISEGYVEKLAMNKFGKNWRAFGE